MIKQKIILYLSILITGALLAVFLGPKAVQGIVVGGQLDMSGNKIINVGPGTTSTDVATYGQMLSASANHYYILGTYISGGAEVPSYFGSNKLKLQMLTCPWTWCDTLWMSSYAGGDVKGSNQLVFSKYGANVGFRRQDYDSGTWGTLYEFIHSDNIGSQSVNYAATAGSAATAVRQPSSGDYVWSAVTTAQNLPGGITNSFVQAANGFPSYGTLINARSYSGGGGGGLQLYVPYGSGYGGTALQYRMADYSAGTSDPPWTAFKTIIDSGNIGSQTVSNSDMLDGYHYNNLPYLSSVTDNWVNTTGDTMSGNLNFNNYGIGVVGTYSATKYQGVFAMGDAYKLPADGSTPGTLYGIAWTHSNVGGESKAGLSHQALFMENGVTKTAIGTGIWTAGNLNFGVANPTINASSYFVAPGGAYFNSGTVYTEAAIQARGGIHNDTNTYLTVSGGTSGYTYFPGNVGIGTTAPIAKLDVMPGARTGTHPTTLASAYFTGALGATDGFRIVHDNGTQGIAFGYTGIQKLASNSFTGNGNLSIDAMSIGNLLLQTISNGNVGIGTTDIETWNSSYSVLQMGGSSSIFATKMPAASNGLNIAQNSYYGDYGWTYILADEASMITMYDGKIFFRTAPVGGKDAEITWVSALTIGPTGNVGIGTTAPDQVLHVAGNISLGRRARSAVTRYFGLTDNTGAFSSDDIVGTTGMIIDQAVSGDTDIYFKTGVWGSQESKKVVIKGSGNVGIGTTAPGTNKLEVVGGPIKATGGLIMQTIVNKTVTPEPTTVGSIWMCTDADGQCDGP